MRGTTSSASERGFADAYRVRHPDAERRYSFWDQKLPFLRKSNRGWRIDYFLVSRKLVGKIRGSGIRTAVRALTIAQ